MDDLQKGALRRSRVFLVSNLMPETLWDHLVANDIFTDLMLENVKCKSPRSEQIRGLLSDLCRRHKEAYEGFLKCLEDTGQGHCAQEIRNNMAELLIEQGRGPVMPETLDPSPESGPTFGALPRDPSTPSSNVDGPMRDTNSPFVAQESQQNSGSYPATNHHDYWYYKERDPNDVYEMETSPRGVVYIINNQTFQHMENRDGSEKDRDNLRNLFMDLYFVVYIDNNLKASQMKENLKTLSHSDQLSTVDSCIIVILSHGSCHKVYGVDAKPNEADSYCITDDELKEMFNNINCKDLLGKPKLFLIQACRGSNEDRGVPSLSSNQSTSPSTTSPSQDGAGVISDTRPEPNSSVQETVVPAAEASCSLPRTTDLVIAHSSDDGCVSYRDESGSIFIKEVIKVFREHAHDTHMIDMLTTVSRNVAIKFATNLGNKMMPHPTTRLLRKWFLNPVSSPVP